MSAALIDLVSVGAQDVYITGDPQVSFFRQNYKRHTNFAHVVERQVIQGNPTAGSISTIRLERKGDLVSYIYLTHTDSANNFTSSNSFEFVGRFFVGVII